MVLKRVGKNKWVILHHKTKGKIGKRIPATRKPVSHAKALKIHRAIWASKKRRKR